MDEAAIDAQVAQVMVGLMKVRRELDPESFDALIGAVLIEIDLGMQLAEEAALERTFRRRPAGNVVKFPPAPSKPGNVRTDP